MTVTAGAGVTNLTTTNTPGFAGYALAMAINFSSIGPADPNLLLWNPVIVNNSGNPIPYTVRSGFHLALDRVVRSPANLTIPALPGVPAYTVILAFKASQPSNFPIPLGDFIDFYSLDQVRYQCRAYGLWGSLSLNSQSPASDWLKTLYFAANAAPVYLGSKLYSIPYAEQSFAGNGAFYTSPTSPGPVANLNADNGDFVGNDGCPKMQTVDRIGLPNVLQLQCLDRNSNYNQIVVQQPDAASIALYGERKADPIVCNAVHDPSIARALLGIQVRKNQYGGDVWSFTASARWMLLSPMDLITLTDPLQSIFNVPVRITSYQEQEDGSFAAEAEPFVYGMYSPTALPVTSPETNPLPTDTSAGNVNPPIIFEPTPPLYPGLGGDQLWVIVSSESPYYGGCQVMISTDGGASYSLAGPPLIGSAVTGFLTLPWPAAMDPDTTNNLSVDLTESNGVLQSYSTTVENNFEYPCYVQSTGSSEEVNGVPVGNGDPMTEQINGTAVATLNTEQVNGTSIAASTASDGFGYELMSYAVATLTGTNKFELMATGSGNELRRSIQLAPSSTGAGVGHSAGARFALITPAATGILKLPMPTLVCWADDLFQDSELQRIRRGCAGSRRRARLFLRADRRPGRGLKENHDSREHRQSIEHDAGGALWHGQRRVAGRRRGAGRQRFSLCACDGRRYRIGRHGWPGSRSACRICCGRKVPEGRRHVCRSAWIWKRHLHARGRHILWHERDAREHPARRQLLRLVPKWRADDDDRERGDSNLFDHGSSDHSVSRSRNWRQLLCVVLSLALCWLSPVSPAMRRARSIQIN